MEILVCIKQVPETRDVEVDERTGVLKREGVESVINPYDLYALEAGIRLKEQYGGKVTVMSMGPPQATQIIKEAYMMGADAGVLLSDRKFAGADTLATAYTLAQGIKKSGNFDLIVCGLQTTDGDTAQVGPGIAEFLDIPHEAYVSQIQELTDKQLSVVRDFGSSSEQILIELPCLITVTKEINQPRLLSYRRKVASREWPITILTTKELTDSHRNNYFGLEGSPTQVERIFPPDKVSSHELWEGDSDELSTKIYHKLAELKLV